MSEAGIAVLGHVLLRTQQGHLACHDETLLVCLWLMATTRLALLAHCSNRLRHVLVYRSGAYRYARREGRDPYVDGMQTRNGN